jgi:hypothetical protein
MLDGISTLIFADGADLIGILRHADGLLGIARSVAVMGSVPCPELTAELNL